MPPPLRRRRCVVVDISDIAIISGITNMVCLVPKGARKRKARSAPGQDTRSGQGALARDTQTGRYGRLYSRRRLCARRSSRRTIAPPDPCRLPATFATSPLRGRCVPKTYRYRYFANTVYVTVSRVNAYSGGVLARALPEGLRYLSTRAWLSSDMVKTIIFEINNTPQKLIVLPNTQLLGTDYTP